MSSTDISRVDVPVTVQPEGQAIALPSDVSQAITQMAQIMQGMANMVRATNERMGMLEQQVRLLTKVTPAQASAIVATSPERKNAITRNVTKKIIAVPKSFINARHPQMAAE